MNKFISLEEAIFWLENIKRFSDKTDINYLIKIVERLDLAPTCPSVQVTGTNGKGSTCIYTSSALSKLGYQVGLFLSPYVEKFNERISINGNNISNQDLLDEINKYYDVYGSFSDAEKEYVSFFDSIFLISLSYFQKYDLNYIIFEVGIGGSLDSTSSINHKVVGITSIGLDHMKILGENEREIAKTKVTVVKEGYHLVTTAKSKYLNIFQKYCDLKKATMEYIDIAKEITFLPNNSYMYQDLTFKLKTAAIYQVNNSILAYKIIKYLIPNADFDLINQTFSELEIYGRMSSLNYKDCPVVLDCAHNIDAIKTLLLSLKKVYHKKNIFLFSGLADKNPLNSIEFLLKKGFSVIITDFVDKRSQDFSQTKPLNNLTYIPSIQEALDTASKIAKDSKLTLVITGSIHFLSAILPIIRQAN